MVSAKAALLQVLTHGGPGFGLELIDRVRARTRGKVKLGQGSAYPALRVLEHQGLISGRDEAPGRRGRPRRYYRLTARGARAAAEHVRIVAGLFGLPVG